MKILPSQISPAAILAIALTLTTAAYAQDHETTLYNFAGAPDGQTPVSLIADASGNFYGVTTYGGNLNCDLGCGTVFKLSKSGGVWVETILYDFTDSHDGANPTGIVMDASGNIYGFASGNQNTGTTGSAFRLSHSFGAWRFTLLHVFGSSGVDGVYPMGAPVLDAAGNLYGVTNEGGYKGNNCTYGCGTFFELTPTATGLWSETILYDFTGTPDATYPKAGLIADGAGSFYGTSSYGGANASNCAYGCGSVYELSPVSGGGWTESVLHSFNGPPTDGRDPIASLAFDTTGNLYGTTYFGGKVDNADCFGDYCGAAFEMSPVSGGGWTEKLIHSFNFTTDGGAPTVGVTVDSAGNLYGLTGFGQSSDGGSAYKLSQDAAGQWKLTLLYALNPTSGESPYGSSPILDSAGNLYFAAQAGGTKGSGSIIKLTPAAASK